MIYRHKTRLNPSVTSTACEHLCADTKTMLLHRFYTKLDTFFVLSAAILDHHYLSAQNKIQCFHCIPHVKTYAYTPTLCLYIDYIKRYVRFSKSSNVSDGHLGFMQIKQNSHSCHSGKRWIWLPEALSNTNPSKKLTVPTISGFHFWLLDYLLLNPACSLG